MCVRRAPLLRAVDGGLSLIKAAISALLSGLASSIASGRKREGIPIIDFEDAAVLPGKTLRGSGGEPLGVIDAVYADHSGGALTFAAVHRGASGVETTFVPLVDAVLTNDVVAVPYSIDLVMTAPTVDAGADLDLAVERHLYEYYGVTALEARDQQSADSGGPMGRGWDDGDPA
jgi:hypothetical protein